MKTNDTGERSSDLIQKKMVKAIIESKYPVGSSLPSERDLASELGVGRPTVREALQRLNRDGWIETKKGQPAVVNDYWRKGNLTTLENIIRHQDGVPSEFVVYLLELRLLLAPAYTREAVLIHRPKVIALLAHLEELKDDAASYAKFDWDLQKGIASLSANPVYLLIMNSFDSFYVRMAEMYFESKENRNATSLYYTTLLTAALNGDGEETKRIVQAAMEESIILWKNGSMQG